MEFTVVMFFFNFYSFTCFQEVTGNLIMNCMLPSHSYTCNTLCKAFEVTENVK